MRISTKQIIYFFAGYLRLAMEIARDIIRDMEQKPGEN